MADPRSKWLVQKLVSSTGLQDYECDKVVEKAKKEVEAFYTKDGPEKILFFFQERQPGSGKPEVFLSNGNDKLTGKCIYFLRVNPKGVDPQKLDLDMSCGEIIGTPLQAFQQALSLFYVPALRGPSQEWGEADENATKEFLDIIERFQDTLTDAVNSLAGGVELRLPDEKLVDLELKPASVSKAAGDTNTVNQFETVMDSWISEVNKLLGDVDMPRRDANDVGPASELDYWRNRMARFNNVAEQLKKKECKFLISVLTSAKSNKASAWKQADSAMTDGLNEAKDNVKYLSTLEKYTETLYHGTPAQITDTLPGLLNNVKMMITIARYYSSPERMTTLFVKITNQMIQNCRKYISGNGRIWDQPPLVLVEKLESCLALNETYQEQYLLQKERLAEQPKVKQFDFNESQIFGKFDLFCKRVMKLVDLFTTIHQFSSLADHNIEGMDLLIKNFFTLVDEFKRKPYDLLDYSKNAFDRDFLEYNVNIAELETAIQGFVNASFENISSTEQALLLIQQFEAILLRENLRADLESKYTVIFHNYGLDLETVQKIYEKQKNCPPMFRNAPPVAGNIVWARHLLHRIEEPMRNFKSNKNIMGTKDSKKIIKSYNRVARALIEFETLWHQVLPPVSCQAGSWPVDLLPQKKTGVVKDN
jgi:dynein heavy chain